MSLPRTKLSKVERGKLAAQLKREFNTGVPVRVLSEKYGLSRRFIDESLELVGVQRRRPRGRAGLRGEERARLAAELMKRWDSGESVHSLRQKFWLSKSLFYKLVQEAREPLDP